MSEEKKTENNEDSPSPYWLVLVAASCGVLIILSAIWLFVPWIYPESEMQGQFGDMFGIANAFFSGLAFAGILYTLHLQQKEMKILNDQHEANIKIMKKQLEIENIKLKDLMLPTFVKAKNRTENIHQSNNKNTLQYIKNTGRIAQNIRTNIISKQINQHFVDLKVDEATFDIWDTDEEKSIKITHAPDADEIMFFYITFDSLDNKHWQCLCQLPLERGVIKNFNIYPPEEIDLSGNPIKEN